MEGLLSTGPTPSSLQENNSTKEYYLLIAVTSETASYCYCVRDEMLKDFMQELDHWKFFYWLTFFILRNKFTKEIQKKKKIFYSQIFSDSQMFFFFNTFNNFNNSVP